MTLPKSVRIGYLDYAIEECQEEDFEGDFNRNLQRIRVRSDGRSREFAANTFLHEILHGIFYHENLMNTEGMNELKEEQIVNAIANGLTEVIRDNPKQFKFITDSLK